MESLQLKNAIFCPNEIIILRKKGNITIHVDDIESIWYHKPTIWDFMNSKSSSMWQFIISLNKEINGLKKYGLLISYKNVKKIQTFFQKEIHFI